MSNETKFRQEDIIEAAFDLVRRYGWEGLSARAIAKELGASTMPIYSTLKSMGSIEEEVIKMAFSLLRQSMHMERTGDRWLDFGLGYVLFAREERNLFRCIHQERYTHLHEKYCFPQYSKNYETLRSYPSFRTLNEKEIEWVAYARYTLVHGMASLMNLGLLDIAEADVIEYLRDIQATLLAGVKARGKCGGKHPYRYMRFIANGKCGGNIDG
jgi:AcrR family transcriptional regulator